MRRLAASEGDMNETIDKTNWTDFFREYSARNKGRPTRLGIFETRDGVANDFWIEDGLPLVALDVYTKNGKTRVDILFENYTHPIDDAANLVHIGGDEGGHGLDIQDADGKTTLLRFENWPLTSED